MGLFQCSELTLQFTHAAPDAGILDIIKRACVPQDIERLTSPDRDYHASIQFTYYLQYHLHLQLLDASKHAARLRIALKGDLPIGVLPLVLPFTLNSL